MATKFISEVSSNHFQDLDRCFEFIDTSAEIGCWGVKFQLFRIDELFAKEVIASRPDIQERKKWELPASFIPKLKARCIEKNINFGCTPFFLEAVDILDSNVDFFKVASYELLWLDLIKKCASTHKDLIISTGMANMDEIIDAVNVAESILGRKPSLMHCSSIYPSHIDEVNLSAIQTIRDKTGCDVGWSDHSNLDEVIVAASLKWDANFIEFHLDLDGKGEEFSAGHCWLPDRAKKIINFLNNIENTAGTGLKEPHPNEIAERPWRADPSDGLRPHKSIRSSIA